MINKASVKLILKISFYISLLVYFIFTIYNYNTTNHLFIVNDISIDGLNYLSHEELLSLIEIKNDESIFKYDISKIKNDIENNPFVKTAKISIKIPNQLHVEIIERIPLALISYNKEQFFIDYDNYLLPANSKSINHFPTPIINIQNDNLDFNINDSRILLIKYLFANYNSLYNNTSELLESSLIITLLTDDKTKIFINSDMLIDNINKLKKFENSIKHLKQINDHKYINLIYKNQIVVKERNTFKYG